MDYDLIDLTDADRERYWAFMRIGLRAHSDMFRISVADSEGAPFPTKGAPDSFTIGAVDRVTGEWLGVVSFAREGETREKLRHKGLLFFMYVASDQSGKGVGRTLIQTVIDRARLLPNLEQINLTVVATNDRARRLYESFGFVTYGRETRAIQYEGRYFDEEFMALNLR